MIRHASLVAALALATLTPVANAQSLWHADQDGAQEVPPVVTPAIGNFDILLTGSAGSYALTFTGSYSGLIGNYTASHLHQAPVGVGGPVVLDLAAFHTPAGATAGSWKGTKVPISDTLASNLMSGNIYINTHSSFKPGGEIRGQLLSVAAQPFHADQTGAQEVPPVTTDATGDFDLLLSGAAGSYKVSFTGSYKDLTQNYTASHLHQAPVGVAGPVVLDLAAFHTPSGTLAGSWAGVAVPVSDTLANNLMSGNIYINTHSSFKPGGEIRGQLNEVADPCYPDCDASGSLDIDDFICFQTFFALSDPYADCDGDTQLSIDDFICFQTFFAIGCG